ncbi:heavy metal-associated domain-containing protein [Aureisphaera galaxeae]|nr:heavy metal-associated domain-containing protein [Aureisphaera galaxeae]MDC8003057.1 heavy metal-associated domain-containing protein [Aureisphaera galaxeae]
MTKIYAVSGMTCEGCRETVQKKIGAVDGVTSVTVDLKKGKAIVASHDMLDIAKLQTTLGTKYQISPMAALSSDTASPSKLRQLRPLLLIFVYLVVAVVLLNYKEGNFASSMLDFMGLFFIVFSFFKLLDLKGFPPSFSMYDPLAKALPLYGWIYPFLEIGLGIMFLLRWEVKIALYATIVLLGITTIGVLRTLLDKRKIKCACLGTALNLPMTEATFIENTLMIAMAIFMLLNPTAL